MADGGPSRAPRAPNVATIAPGAPFLDTLAAAILSGDLPHAGGTPPDPLDLPDLTVFLPTRRAARELREAFLRAGGGAAVLCPRIRPLGDPDEDEGLLAPAPEAAGPEPDGLQPAIGGLERRLTLARLVQKWAEVRRAEIGAGDVDAFVAPGLQTLTPAQAIGLADELSALLDTLEAEGVEIARLPGLVPDDFAKHWQDTLKFLKIISDNWPAHLTERGLISAIRRRDALIDAETARWAAGEGGPVIAAGSTGTVPAVARLLAAIAHHRQGAVVLPGLDLGLDAESWQAIASEGDNGGSPDHPQFAMAQVLPKLGLAREDVREIGGKESAASRARFLSEAMRPAATTAQWQAFAHDPDARLDAALHGVTAIAAATSEEEAEAIALVLRREIETPGRTVALVTPDRDLARRVAGLMARWDVRVDDSAGRPLMKTVPAVFLDLVVDAAASDFAPVPLLALLQHPLTKLGRAPAGIRGAARTLELVALRGLCLHRGLEGLADVMRSAREQIGEDRHAHPARRRLTAADWEAAESLVAELRTAFAPLAALSGCAEPLTIPEALSAHLKAAEALAKDRDGSTHALWAGEAGETLATTLSGLLAQTAAPLGVAWSDYPDLFRALLRGGVVRPRAAAHPRVFLWGPLEARLMRPDTVVLGGLNEGVWPATVETGAWLNRPMRTELGLPAPERRIGQSAHDFAQLLAAPRVFLTRAEKSGGNPTVASRWWLRLEALLEGADARGLLDPAETWIAWARARTAAAGHTPARVPEPKPPLAARPSALSVTQIETWLANPYAIYARHVLRLQPLDALDEVAGPALRGMLVHDALQRFTVRFPERLPADIAGELASIARDVFAPYAGLANVQTFWRQTFAAFCGWFAETEPARRENVARIVCEARGVLDLGSEAAPFRLSAYADRIDAGRDGSLVIYDYKTGKPPKNDLVDDGYKPQLPLEAAIAIRGGFADVAAAPVTSLRYIHASGRNMGDDTEREAGKTAPDLLATEALASLRALVADFSDPETGYPALRRARFSYDYDDYAHLARVAEWAGEGEGT